MFDIFGTLFGGKLTEDDIPDTHAVRGAFLEALKDGKGKSFKAVCDSAEKQLAITNKQRSFKIKGSPKPLLACRFELVWSELKNEGKTSRTLIPGRMKLTAEGRDALIRSRAVASSASSKKSVDEKLSRAVDVDSSTMDRPAYGLIDDDADLANATFNVSAGSSRDADGRTVERPTVAEATDSDKGRKSREGVIPAKSLIFKPRVVIAGGAAAALCLSAALAFGAGGGSAPAKSQTPSTSETTSEAATDEKTDGVLSFTLEPGTDVPNLRFQVLVDGRTNEGEAVHEYYSAEVGTKYALQYGAGTYALSVVAGTLTHENVVYKATDASVDFDAKADKALELKISKDAEATSALVAAQQKEAEQKAAEEAAKKAEEEAAAKAAEEEAAKKAQEEAAAKAAEEQRQAEEEAARQKAEEQERNAEESASTETKDRTVYITKTGTKYHNASCRHIKKSKIEIKLSDAIARGYEACGTCGG